MWSKDVAACTLKRNEHKIKILFFNSFNQLVKYNCHNVGIEIDILFGKQQTVSYIAFIPVLED